LPLEMKRLRVAAWGWLFLLALSIRPMDLIVPDS
jgi:hypothetical protein